MNKEYRLLPVALAPHIKDAIRASGHFMPESLWAAIIAAHDLGALRKSALQELADIAQEYNMGYGSAATERSETLADENRFQQVWNDALTEAIKVVEGHKIGYVDDDKDLDIVADSIRELKSAPAASSSAAPSDERAAFEQHECHSVLTRNPEGSPDDYQNPCVESAWQGWMARATLAAPAASPAVLTDAQIDAAMLEVRIFAVKPLMQRFARAIERHITGQAGGGAV